MFYDRYIHLFCYFRYLLNADGLVSESGSEGAATKRQHFWFLGVLLGVAVRTKKPIALSLAPLVWKLIARSGRSYHFILLVLGENIYLFSSLSLNEFKKSKKSKE